MIRKEIFICEYCKTSYDSEKSCKDCEKSHAKTAGMRIDSVEFEPFIMYPSTIRVTFSNGKYSAAYRYENGSYIKLKK